MDYRDDDDEQEAYSQPENSVDEAVEDVAEVQDNRAPEEMDEEMEQPSEQMQTMERAEVIVDERERTVNNDDDYTPYVEYEKVGERERERKEKQERERKLKQEKEQKQIEEEQKYFNEFQASEERILTKRENEQKILQAQKKFAQARQMERKTSAPAILGTQVGAMLGFSRTGLIGDKIDAERLKKQEAERKAAEKRVEALTELRNVQKSRVGEIAKVRPLKPEDTKGLDDLMKQIDKFQSKANVQKDKEEQLRQRIERDKAVKYIRMTTKSPGKGKKGVAQRYDMFGAPLGSRAKPSGKLDRALMGITAATSNKSYDKIIANLNKSMPRQQKPVMRPEDSDEINQTNQRMKPRITNEFGVEDWMLNI